jgi:hypothetical protein
MVSKTLISKGKKNEGLSKLLRGKVERGEKKPSPSPSIGHQVGILLPSF